MDILLKSWCHVLDGQGEIMAPHMEKLPCGVPSAWLEEDLQSNFSLCETLFT